MFQNWVLIGAIIVPKLGDKVKFFEKYVKIRSTIELVMSFLVTASAVLLISITFDALCLFVRFHCKIYIF